MFGGAAALGSVTTPLLAAPLVTPPSRQRSEKSLFLFNTNTKESENLIYWANGRYIQSTLDKFNILMRDRRTDEVAIIDPKLYDLMWSLRVALKATGPLQIICGYRSSDSNSSMRRVKRGVAKNSYHMQGKAVDLRFAGYPIKTIGSVARGLKGGGVGTYRGSKFVHIDTGPIRSW